MREALENYKPVHETQKIVLSFLTSDIPYQRVVSIEARNSKQKDLERYISASKFWVKKDTRIIAPNGDTVIWTFAVNDQMEAVICRYRGWFIVTTKTSHSNIMRELEGKYPWKPIQWDNPAVKKKGTDKILNMLKKGKK